MIIYNYLTYVNYFDCLNVVGNGSIMKRKYRGAQGCMKEQAAKDQVTEVRAMGAIED
jgi:hypothetical protein